jgi:hypothetical protein
VNTNIFSPTLIRYRLKEAFEQRPYIFSLFVILIIILNINVITSKFLTGLGLLCNIAATLGLYLFSDEFLRRYIHTITNNGRDSEGKTMAANSLGKKSDKTINWILFYLVVGFILQLIGLWIDP